MTSSMFNLPVLPHYQHRHPFIIFVTKGNYKINQNIMLLSSFFYVVYIFLRLKQNQTGWPPSPSGYSHGINLTTEYIRDFIIIGLGVLGTR